MSTLTWTTEKRKVSELKAADYNPRKLSEQEEIDLEASIEEFGTVIPVVVNIGKRKNILIGGHQRTKLYEKRGIDKVEVMVPSRELTKVEEKKLNLRLNKNTGSWDQEKLKEMDLTMLLEVGFGDEDLQMFFDDVDVLEDTYNAERAIKEMTKPTVKSGEVWQLGDHRIMCGDSMDLEQVKTLMNNDLADVVYCDPPYNIGLNYQKGTNIGGNQRKSGTKAKDTKRKYDHGETTFKNDKKSYKDYGIFIDTAIKNALEVAKPNTHVFFWCDERNIWVLQTLFKQNGVDNKRVCMWIKNNFSPTPQIAFNKSYEPCVYGTRGTPYLNTALRGLTEVMNKEVEAGNQIHEDILEIISLWPIKRDHNGTYEHPTQKPINLNERPLKRTSAPGHIVLDLFGGSGSTLIACEQIKRKARLMEQDPIFASVIVDRWEKFTNQKAKKV